MEEKLTLKKFAENMPGTLLVYKANENEDILFASNDVIKLFECNSFEDFMNFTGGSFSYLVYPEDIDEVNSVINKQIKASGGNDYVQYRIITKTGKIKNIEDWGRLVHDEDLGDLYYVYLNDVQEREKLVSIASTKMSQSFHFKKDQENEENEGNEGSEESKKNENHNLIFKENMIDELTGILNLSAFHLKGSSFISKISNKGEQPSLIYFNIRNFHTYNETYGFEGGDRMLKSVARILQDTFPDSLTARLSDDHFVVITSKEDLKERITRMSVRVNNIRRGVIVEIKAGIFKIIDPKTDLSVICDRAKFACDNIKCEYGSTVQVYDVKIDEKLHLQEHLLKTFQQSLEKENIKIFFQPVIDIETGKKISYEALTRWEDSIYGTIKPGFFIDFLEEQHLIHKLDIYVIERVCAELNRRREAGEELLPVSLNLSRLDFELTDIVKVIEDSADKYNISREFLRFEITESLIAVDIEAMKNEAERLRRYGFQIWIDAFGAGYSSLKMLKDFELDGLKIDMEMLKFHNDERTNIIISSVIELARKLNIPALSKGVETEEELNFLKKAGCNSAQGFLLGKPEAI